MKKWCKFCGKEITKTDDWLGIWSDPDALIFCYQDTKHRPNFHTPCNDNDLVTRILTKYCNEV